MLTTFYLRINNPYLSTGLIICPSIVRREGIKAVKNNAEQIKKEFKENLKNKDLTLHFDGKSVKEFTAGRHMEQERIAVIVSSPSLEHPQVLGIPPSESSKGVDQQRVLMDVIEEWGGQGVHHCYGF